jgi:hypothetical protein
MTTPNDGFIVHLVSTLAPNPETIANWVAEVRRINPHLSTDEIANKICDRLTWQCSAQGAALALPGAIPGVGTVAQIGIEAGTAGLDFALLVRNQVFMVFALGYCYGIRGREVLIQDTLILIALWSKALVLTKQKIKTIGAKILNNAFKKGVSATFLKSINKKVATTALTKYGTKRGAIAIGKLIPFGVGVAVGGGFNYVTMRSFKKKALGYFSLRTS